MSIPPPQTNGWRVLRRCLIGLAAAVTLISLFYTEENLRGKAAWENCKRALEAKGISLNWADSIPAQVPDNENVFGVPEMQRLFTDRGATDLSRKMAYPGTIRLDETNAPANGRNKRLVVADLKIQRPSASTDNASNVLQWGDLQAPEQAARLIKDALGSVALHPGSTDLLFTARSLDAIRPAQILIECQTEPTTDDLLQFLPKIGDFTDTADVDRLQLEPTKGGYLVTMPAPDTTEDFLKWNAQFEPEFSLIDKACQRPYVRMNGNYNEPTHVPIPNFVTSRIFAQSLSTMAQCHLLEAKPDEALADLTRMHGICRIFTNRPITLLGAMLNEAVRGVYADTVADGLRWHAWREPQLAALQEQLKTMDVISSVHQSLRWEFLADCEDLRSIPITELLQTFAESAHLNGWNGFKQQWEARLIPHGWIYQSMATAAERAPKVDTWLDPANRAVFPKHVDADQAALSSVSGNPPYSFILFWFTPNIARACQRTALFQTKVDQANIACALERYHLERGEYPENLNALVPQFIEAIPDDVIGGQPPHYRRAANGTFLLYSIGWSGRDGGGVAKTNNEGDWIWPEPN